MQNALVLGHLCTALAARTLLFAAFQGLFALGFALSDVLSPWQASIAWWPMSASLANLANLGLLVRWARRDGVGLRDLYGWRRESWRGDLVRLLWSLLVIAPLAVAPNLILGAWLFGDASVASAMMFRPLPMWAVLVLFPLFPFSIALTEMPTYYGYVLPRLQEATGRRWLPILLAGCLHSAQHIALPLILDWRFIVWRLFMFLPFALFVAWLIDRRRSTLPWLMGVHGLLDAQLPLFVLLATLGTPAFG